MNSHPQEQPQHTRRTLGLQPPHQLHLHLAVQQLVLRWLGSRHDQHQLEVGCARVRHEVAVHGLPEDDRTDGTEGRRWRCPSL